MLSVCSDSLKYQGAVFHHWWYHSCILVWIRVRVTTGGPSRWITVLKFEVVCRNLRHLWHFSCNSMSLCSFQQFLQPSIVIFSHDGGRHKQWLLLSSSWFIDSFIDLDYLLQYFPRTPCWYIDCNVILFGSRHTLHLSDNTNKLGCWSIFITMPA